MRLHFSLSPNSEIVPFNYQDKLISVFHKWMGWNKIHDEISLYSLSWLQGGKTYDTGLNFSHGAKWFVSFWDESIGKMLIKNAMNNPELFCGMIVEEILIQETPQFGCKERFITSSPIFIRKYDSENRAIHLTSKDPDVNLYLTETLKRKLKSAGLNLDVKVEFDNSFLYPKTKLVRINGIDCKANICPVIVEGQSDAVKFAWNVGIGHLTGCGFGSLF